MSKLDNAWAELRGAIKAGASPESIRMRKRRLMVVLAEDLGLNQREREVISQFCVRAEHAGADYESVHGSGPTLAEAAAGPGGAILRTARPQRH